MTELMDEIKQRLQSIISIEGSGMKDLERQIVQLKGQIIGLQQASDIITAAIAKRDKAE